MSKKQIENQKLNCRGCRHRRHDCPVMLVYEAYDKIRKDNAAVEAILRCFISQSCDPEGALRCRMYLG